MGVTGKPTLLEVAKEVAKEASAAWLPVADEVFVCGSIRRRCDVVSDVDLLIVAEAGSFESLPHPPGWHVTPKTCNRWLRDVWVEGWLVRPEVVGPAMVFLTGPADLNVFMRRKALKMGMQLSQHGLVKRTRKERVDSNTEESVFEVLELPYLHPWERQTWAEEYRLTVR